MLYVSKLDGKELKSKQQLLSYNSKRGISKEQTIADLLYNGIRKTCKCGCGQLTTYNTRTCDLSDFIHGHFARTEGNPTKGLTKEQGKKHMGKTLASNRKRLSEGTLNAWNKGLSADTDERVKAYGEKQRGKIVKQSTRQNVSKSRKKYFEELRHNSPEEYARLNEHMRVYWAKEENRKAQAKRQAKNVQKMEWRRSKFEMEVEAFLIKNNINFKSGFRISTEEYNKVYDFLINGYILLEADGDFFHCNPKQFPNGPVYDRQKYHVENDKIKNKLAEDNGFKLIRIWLSDFRSDNYLLLQKIKEVI